MFRDMSLKIHTVEDIETNQVLVSPAKSVEFPLSQELSELIANMKATLIDSKAVGLAATQVGYPWQLIAYKIDQDAASIRSNAFETVELTILINPSYQPHENATLETDWEGCLSVSELTGKVPRYNSIYFQGYDEIGHKVQGIAKGFTARVLQHEIDHINGVLIIDKLDNASVKGHPKDMAMVRINEMNPVQRSNMKVLIQKIMAGKKENSHYGPILQYIIELEAKEQK